MRQVRKDHRSSLLVPACVDRLPLAVFLDLIKNELYSIQAMRRIFVAPDVPNGTPAVITIGSPTSANPSDLATLIALLTISRKA